MAGLLRLKEVKGRDVLIEAVSVYEKYEVRACSIRRNINQAMSRLNEVVHAMANKHHS